MPSEPPPSTQGAAPDRPDSERERGRIERLLPELIKRLLESGIEKLSEAPENARQLVGELRLPKDMLALLLAQADETKTGLYRVVAKETRDFLEHTNFAEEFARVLTTLSFEIKTEVRFIPNDTRLGASPDVKAKVRIKRADGDKRGLNSEPPPGPDAPPDGEPR